MKLNVSYDFRAKQSSCRAAVVMDHFGIGFETGPHVIAAGFGSADSSGGRGVFYGGIGFGEIQFDAGRLPCASGGKSKRVEFG